VSITYLNHGKRGALVRVGIVKNGGQPCHGDNAPGGVLLDFFPSLGKVSGYVPGVTCRRHSWRAVLGSQADNQQLISSCSMCPIRFQIEWASTRVHAALRLGFAQQEGLGPQTEP